VPDARPAIRPYFVFASPCPRKPGAHNLRSGQRGPVPWTRQHLRRRWKGHHPCAALLRLVCRIDHLELTDGRDRQHPQGVQLPSTVGLSRFLGGWVSKVHGCKSRAAWQKHKTCAASGKNVPQASKAIDAASRFGKHVGVKKLRKHKVRAKESLRAKAARVARDVQRAGYVSLDELTPTLISDCVQCVHPQNN